MKHIKPSAKSAEEIKNKLIRLLAKQRVDDDIAPSLRDKWTKGELRDAILNILKEAGFQDVEQELEREFAAAEDKSYNSGDEDE